MFEYAAEELGLIRRGSRIRDRMRIAAMSARLHLAARGIDLPRADLEVGLKLAPDLDLRLRRTDFILFEVIGFGSYDFDLEPLGQVQRVLDAGANIGLATIRLSQRLPGARFVAVEPAGSSFELLKRNLKANLPGAIAVHAAVTAEPGAVTIQQGRNSMLTRVVSSTAANAATVAGKTIAQLLDETGLGTVDLMKLDIEGGEHELLRCAGTWADRVGALIAEIHSPMTVSQAAEQLAPYGYQRLPLPPLPRFTDLLLAAKSRDDTV